MLISRVSKRADGSELFRPNVCLYPCSYRYLHSGKSRKCCHNMPACLRSRENAKKKMHVFQAGAKKTSLTQPLEGSHFSSYRQLDLLEYCLGPRGFFKVFFAEERASLEENFQEKILSLIRIQDYS